MASNCFIKERQGRTVKKPAAADRHYLGQLCTCTCICAGETGVAGVEPVSEMLSKLSMTLAFVKLSKRVGDLAFTDSQQKAAISSTDVVSREDNGQQQKTQLKADYWQYDDLLKLMS